jgi:hypothetical protein
MSPTNMRYHRPFLSETGIVPFRFSLLLYFLLSQNHSSS